MKNRSPFIVVSSISIMLLVVGIYAFRTDKIPNADDVRKKKEPHSSSFFEIVNQAFTKFEDTSKLGQQITAVLFEYQDNCCKNIVIIRIDSVLYLLATNSAQSVNRMSSEKQKTMSFGLLAYIMENQSTLPLEAIKRIGMFKLNSENNPKLYVKNGDGELFKLTLDSDNMSLPTCMNIAKKVTDLLLETTGYHPSISGFEKYHLNQSSNEN
ncbi:hypothetical protein SAMN04488029_3030 [Reichenbachiella faecimaris]|uniref:Uncharacterized protein n=1 Tax=Reichenbachiella faecimaris TaxID=692418 RepID=A0A1W2GJ75_REIFA|nr:hypothetical protein [Reichenbachiella faecimaris]SMD36707.1 hypothetical protein SAMN04488029_3030 [Reichenbachiella faecimaris]